MGRKVCREESAKNCPVRTAAAAKRIKGEAELGKFMKEWEKIGVDQQWML